MEDNCRIHIPVIIAGMLMAANNMLAQQLNTDFKKDFKGKNHESELKLNEEAIKLIKFDFMQDFNDEENKPLEAPLEKSWMKFKADLAVPKSLTDTTKVRKPTGYIRMLPYSIWTKFGEDPVYDVMVFGKKQKDYQITWTINPYGNYDDNYGLGITPSAGSISDGIRIRGAGITIGGLDFMGLIYDNLTPRGRMLKHNRKHANAWKIYQTYQPTKADSLKFPTFYSGMTSPVFDYSRAGKDTAIIGDFPILSDSARAEIEKVTAIRRDSLRKEYLEKANEEADKDRSPDRVKRNFRWNVRKAKAAKRMKDEKDKLKEKEQKMLDELPGSMDSIYNYMRQKEKREAEERARQERIRKMRFEVE